MHLKSSALCMVGVAGVLALAGCGGASSVASSNSATSARARPRPLVVYAAEGYDQAMVTAFQKATGIPTRLYDDHTGIVLAKVQAEQNNPHWGVLWCDGNIAHAFGRAGAATARSLPAAQPHSGGQCPGPRRPRLSTPAAWPSPLLISSTYDIIEQ
jgi:iron(III) transport system substrate-binding protein